MEAPPNFGRDYVVSFHQVYPALAKQYGVAARCRSCSKAWPASKRLNQSDGIHPTAEGARIVADHVWSVLEPMLRAEAMRSPRRGASRMIELRKRCQRRSRAAPSR